MNYTHEVFGNVIVVLHIPDVLLRQQQVGQAFEQSVEPFGIDSPDSAGDFAVVGCKRIRTTSPGVIDQAPV
ncbi:MAG TPA: hypothetical protein VIH42_12045 [Thermoguttaceae bacterium]